MATMLARTYGPAFLADYEDSSSVPDSPATFDPLWFFSQVRTLPPGIRCVHGHFCGRKYYSVRPRLLITVLRHPIDLMFSLYFYWQKAPPNAIIQKHMLKNNHGILDLAAIPLLRRLQSEVFFGGESMADYALIGRHEAMGPTLDRLSGLLGAPLPRDIYENTTPASDQRKEMEYDPSIRARLGVLLEDDIRFYERYAFRDIA